jgi:hypothetical protein
MTWSPPTVTELPHGITASCQYKRTDTDNPCGKAPRDHVATYLDQTQDVCNGRVVASRKRYLCFQAVCAVRLIRGETKKA